MSFIDSIRGGLNTAADLSGATRTVKVGANLAQNTGRVLTKRPRKPLYAPQTSLVELFRDALGIGTIGSAALGGIAGMAGSGAAKGGAAIPGVIAPTPPPFQATFGGVGHAEALARSAKVLKALQEALRAGEYIK